MTFASELQIIKDLEERLHIPALRKNQGMVDALLADDFLEFGRSGREYGKAEIVRALATEEVQELRKLTAYGYELRKLAADVLLLTYRTVQRQPGAPDLHTLRSSIWKQVGNRWQMAFHQGTPTGPEG
ncbi:nuclear transport factor 2 family protein [Sphingomonas adhaesiva]|uniref:nuclear transport factor 2 family protein n=1 Tax=Sphingomonas adhaesiva TaxID=28212 RepID=UPI002FF9E38F